MVLQSGKRFDWGDAFDLSAGIWSRQKLDRRVSETDQADLLWHRAFQYPEGIIYALLLVLISGSMLIIQTTNN